MMTEKVKIAILDMNNDEPNQGLRCIKEIAAFFNEDAESKVFNVRAKNELPDTSFDIYISSGGPGSPLDEGKWRKPYLELMQKLWEHNENPEFQKKYVFFICYSFQVICNYFELGTLKPRRSTSFGILPIHKTISGLKDPLLNGLEDPYYAVDSRDWQLVQPRLKVFKEHGATILSIERIRTNVEYERAIMAVRFSKEFVGTQFHPEADPLSMKAHFLAEENMRKVITNFGEETYNDMMTKMDDPEKLMLTYRTILPEFIRKAIMKIRQPVIS